MSEAVGSRECFVGSSGRYKGGLVRSSRRCEFIITAPPQHTTFPCLDSSVIIFLMRIVVVAQRHR